MAATARITGKDLYVTFDGTPISGDYTSVTVNEEEDLADLTAGADEYHYFVNMRRNGTIDFEAFYAGSAVMQALDPGAAGTLVIAPKGTVAANPQWTWARALVQRRSLPIPFDDGIRMTATFQLSSEISDTVY